MIKESIKPIFLTVIGLIFLQAFSIIKPNNTEVEMDIKPPIAKKEEHITKIHNTELVDQYHWLRAKNWPEKITDEEVLDYVRGENAYFEHYIKQKDDLKNELFEELKGRIKLADQSTYVKKDDYYYYSRTEEDQEYGIYCRKKGSTTAKEEILLDVNALAKDQKYTSIGAFSVSPNHKLMAYSTDFTGGEKYTIVVFDLEKQEMLTDKIPDTIGGVTWHENNEGFFYTPTDENWRHDKVMYHKLGSDSKEDKLILHEENNLYSVSAGKSSSREYIFINVSGHDNNEEYFIRMDDEKFTPILIKPKQEKILYSVDHGSDNSSNDKPGYFYVHTNDGGADNFKILRINDDVVHPNKIADDPGKAQATSDLSDFDKNWETYIAEDKEKDLAGFDITKQYMLLNYKYNALPLSVVIDMAVYKSSEIANTNEEAQKQRKISDMDLGYNIINFPDSAYTAGVFSTNYLEDDIRVNYSSLSRPATAYAYDYIKDELSILKVQEIPSGHDPEEYQVERIFAPSKDGVKVPVTLLYKKDLLKKDGSNPVYLYGYGSYGHSTPPSFRNSSISLVNRGFIYAIAHIRGGSDVDYNWYKSAKFLNKKRTFEDFIASADHLVKENYTSKGNIAIMGGSAGGMLMGAVVNMRPELFKLAIAHVPFVDVMNTMLDETLPLTPQEFKEWGNPKDKEYFDYMLSYSPYENVKPQNYPHIFVTAGLSDPRVGYWEAAKWVAKLRDQKTDDNLIMLKTNMEYGHSGASGRFDYLKEAAEDLVFIFERFGIEK